MDCHMAWIWYWGENIDMVLVDLFIAFLRVGLFAIGGAYSFLPLIEREVVEKYHWLTKDEFLDILGMVKVFPGAISIKYATYTGFKVAGIPGLIAANLGNFIGPIGVILFASTLYTKFKVMPGSKSSLYMIQLAVFAMMIAMAFQLVDIVHLIQFKNLLIVGIFFILFLYTNIHPALIIITAGVLGFLIK